MCRKGVFILLKRDMYYPIAHIIKEKDIIEIVYEKKINRKPFSLVYKMYTRLSSLFIKVFFSVCVLGIHTWCTYVWCSCQYFFSSWGWFSYTYIYIFASLLHMVCVVRREFNWCLRRIYESLWKHSRDEEVFWMDKFRLIELNKKNCHWV